MKSLGLVFTIVLKFEFIFCIESINHIRFTCQDCLTTRSTWILNPQNKPQQRTCRDSLDVNNYHKCWAVMHKSTTNCNKLEIYNELAMIQDMQVKSDMIDGMYLEDWWNKQQLNSTTPLEKLLIIKRKLNQYKQLLYSNNCAKQKLFETALAHVHINTWIFHANTRRIKFYQNICQYYLDCFEYTKQQQQVLQNDWVQCICCKAKYTRQMMHTKRYVDILCQQNMIHVVNQTNIVCCFCIKYLKELCVSQPHESDKCEQKTLIQQQKYLLKKIQELQCSCILSWRDDLTETWRHGYIIQILNAQKAHAIVKYCDSDAFNAGETIHMKLNHKTEWEWFIAANINVKYPLQTSDKFIIETREKYLLDWLLSQQMLKFDWNILICDQHHKHQQMTTFGQIRNNLQLFQTLIHNMLIG